MGWNAAYTVLEKQVIDMYNAGLMSGQVAEILVAPFVGTDIDHGGCQYDETYDCKLADEVLMEFLAPDEYAVYVALGRRLKELEAAGADESGHAEYKKYCSIEEQQNELMARTTIAMFKVKK